MYFHSCSRSAAAFINCRQCRLTKPARRPWFDAQIRCDDLGSIGVDFGGRNEHDSLSKVSASRVDQHCRCAALAPPAKSAEASCVMRLPLGGCRCTACASATTADSETYLGAVTGTAWCEWASA